jgi:hypothetical protein
MFTSCRVGSRPMCVVAGRSEIIRSVIGTGFVLLVFVASAAAQTAVPPRVANLVSNSGPFVSSTEFSNLLTGKLTSGGNSNVLNAKFFFQECFGGGMLAGVADSLGGTVKLVGGSASGWADSFDPRDTRLPSYWTGVLLPQLDVDQTIKQALVLAAENDPLGPNGIEWEQSDIVAFNGGDSVKLADPAASSRHAIFWAGDPNGNDMLDIVGMRDALIKAWGDPATNPNVTITTLFGDGTESPAAWNAQAATRENLFTAVNGLSLGPNEEFLFYAADHGRTQQILQSPTAPSQHIAANGGTITEHYSLEPGVLAAIETEDTTVATLELNYTGVSAANSVLVSIRDNTEGVVAFLGYLTPTQTAATFEIPDEALGTSYDVLITNNGTSEVLISSQVLDSGNVAKPSVPEPSGIFLAVGIAFFSILARGTRLRQLGSRK